MGDFKSLRAFQQAKSLVISSRDAIRLLPIEERFLLADQWRRAVRSVALNIAEGASRRGPRQFARYLDYAIGSLDELEAILALVDELGYVPKPQMEALRRQRSDCARMVFGLLRKMSERSGK